MQILRKYKLIGGFNNSERILKDGSYLQIV